MSTSCYREKNTWTSWAGSTHNSCLSCSVLVADKVLQRVEPFHQQMVRIHRIRQLAHNAVPLWIRVTPLLTSHNNYTSIELTLKVLRQEHRRSHIRADVTNKALALGSIPRQLLQLPDVDVVTDKSNRNWKTVLWACSSAQVLFVIGQLRSQ